MRDHYEVLGLGKDASEKEVSAAYRKKALLYHPDRNPGDKQSEERFKEASEAYAVLSDKGKRLNYDRSTEPATDDPFHDPFPGPGSPDFFNNMWGVGPGRRDPRRRQAGQDVEKDVLLSVEESVLGVMKKVSFETSELTACTRCAGTRAEPGARRIPCTSCAGTGKSFFHAASGQGHARCRQCEGYGDTPTRKCNECSGKGSVRVEREFSVKIPPGISDGQRLRLAGKGESGTGGPPGDMYLTVKVAEGGRFARRGNDLFTTVRIPFHTAMADGRQLSVRGIDGKDHRVDIPPGFKPGETPLVVRGAGVGSSLNGERGNMHVTVHVDLPDLKTARAAALVRELVDELSGPSGNWDNFYIDG